MERKVKLIITEKQLRRIMVALEEYFRLRLGQALDFADDICLQNLKIPESDPERTEVFDRYIERRDAVKEGIESLIINVAAEGDWRRLQKTEETIEVIDIWHVIRHWFWQQRPVTERSSWTVDADPVFSMSEEPLPQIGWKEELK